MLAGAGGSGQPEGACGSSELQLTGRGGLEARGLEAAGPLACQPDQTKVQPTVSYPTQLQSCVPPRPPSPSPRKGYGADSPPLRLVPGQNTACCPDGTETGPDTGSETTPQCSRNPG